MHLLMGNYDIIKNIKQLLLQLSLFLVLPIEDDLEKLLKIASFGVISIL